MRQKFNYLFIGLLFSGLAFFSYLFLLLYSDFTPQHLEVLISFKSFILILAAFNLVGFGVLMIHNWQKRSFQFLVKRKERLIIDCILTAIILFLMNYLVLSIVKAIFEVPAPFTLKGSGLRMIALVWLVEMVITNLTLTINFYRQLVLLHERTEQVEENSIKAQYAALQNQLNPHFLFNSLNTLISEIEYAPKNAILFTQRLSVHAFPFHHVDDARHVECPVCNVQLVLEVHFSLLRRIVPYVPFAPFSGVAQEHVPGDASVRDSAHAFRV